MVIRLIISFISALLFISSAAADSQVISADELKAIMDAKKHVTVVDARTDQEYRQGHIPTAISIPPDKLNRIQTMLPKRKDSPIVIYCRGAG